MYGSNDVEEMNVQRYMFAVQRMLVNENATFLPGHAVSSMKTI